jgi:hypothetical protein
MVVDYKAIGGTIDEYAKNDSNKHGVAQFTHYKQ